MKVEITSKIESLEKEVLDIHIEFNPSDEKEEGLAAIVATVADLVHRHKKATDLLNAADE